MTEIASSELVLNPDGSVYHLHLKPENLADTVILVGDQGRVDQFSQHFEIIEFRCQNREFVTATGIYKGKRISVLSTGIGTDNIDIVVNELDALVNIDFANRQPKVNLKSLNLIRIGTCGVIRPEIPTGSTVISEMACGFDGLLRFYGNIEAHTKPDLENAFARHMGWDEKMLVPYFTEADKELFSFMKEGNIPVVTVSAPGFYGPQGRVLRLPLRDSDLHEKLRSFDWQGVKISNFEMECSALYGLSSLLGHRAATICAVIANRATGKFDNNYPETMSRLILQTLNRLVS